MLTPGIFIGLFIGKLFQYSWLQLCGLVLASFCLEVLAYIYNECRPRV